MKTIGIVEAKTRLSALIEAVERGEDVTITRHGRPVARLVPVAGARRADVDEAVARLKAFRRGRRLGGLSIKALIDEGRA